MKRESTKTAKRRRECAPEREAFRREIGKCMLCGRADWHPVQLAVHEILRGRHRQKALAHRELWLLLCDGPGDTCHKIVQDWPLAKQLCLKRHGDGLWLDLDCVREVYGGGVLVTMADLRSVEDEVRAALWGRY